jgi:hypothetical protein
MENKFGQVIEECIRETVDRVLSTTKGELPDIEYVETDSLGEVVEKLAILHIRMWMIEDRITISTSDEELADLKRKVDICFKVKRPRLVEALNLLVDNSISKNKSLREDSVKLYKSVK